MTQRSSVYLLLRHAVPSLLFFFLNDTAPTEIYPLSLHDPLPISHVSLRGLLHLRVGPSRASRRRGGSTLRRQTLHRSEEHTSELQSRQYLVCRLLLEKKKNTPTLNKTAIYSQMYLFMITY